MAAKKYTSVSELIADLRKERTGRCAVGGMKKSYMVTIETKKDGEFPSLAALRSAISNTAPHCDDYAQVSVRECVE